LYSALEFVAITGQPLAEIARLAWIEHTSGIAPHKIHSKPSRKRPEKFVSEPIYQRFERRKKARVAQRPCCDFNTVRRELSTVNLLPNPKVFLMV